jgi:hypothetical protein
MKRFSCNNCNQPVFFDNRLCTSCGAALGFDPEQLDMVSIAADSAGGWRGPDGQSYRNCRNQLEQDACNWLLDSGDEHEYCVSCRLNRTIPDLAVGENHAFWQRIERAKRRLLYSLLWLGLPVARQTRGWPQGLLFDFIESPRTPGADGDVVMTGHQDGVITLNVAEADDVFRAMQRKQMNEAYRTLLGHLRHESGHYFFDHLVDDEDKLQQCRNLFGDEQLDYQAALDRYYQQGPPAGWESAYISAYSAAHPAEDWAESWAHYLHMLDCLETAANYRLVKPLEWDDELDGWLDEWPEFTVLLNELNRAMGLQDAYPFVISDRIADKLRFIHQLLRAAVRSS